MKTLAIVGTGLIGASFGLALRKAGFDGTILGVSSERAIADAQAAGAIDRGATLEEAAGQADLIFLSQAISRILDTIRRLDPLVRPGALITDAGSTKSEIVRVARQSIRRAQFLGGHPMAGKETRGAAAGEDKLYQGRTWVLTPSAPEELETPAAREFHQWLERIGAHIVVLDADRHDRAVAFTSHLAQLASTALAEAVSVGVSEPADLQVAGPGLRDMTRLALSSYELWQDILATNREHIDRALARYIETLEKIRAELPSRSLEEEFRRGAELAAYLRR